MAIKPFFPPRPGITLYFPFLNDYSAQIWLAQRKFKGQRSPVFISKSGEVELWSRHADNDFKHQNYDLTSEMKKNLLSLKLPNEDVVIDAELMHAKTKTLKHVIILFDVLCCGKYLKDMTQVDRLAMLKDFCNDPKKLEEKGRGLVVNDTVWLAETIEGDFLKQYKSMLTVPEIEGLVLRKRDSLLRHTNPSLGRIQHEVSWMVRVRKEEKNYHH